MSRCRGASVFFFFKQETAYDMRISDWSSDVCSSDLLFVHVVAAGSLSAAARARGISPAMVSKRIARLEARLGVRLLHRTTRRLALTPRGAVFHRDMVAVLAAIGEAEAHGADPGHLSGALVVNAPPSFGALPLPPPFRPFPYLISR